MPEVDDVADRIHPRQEVLHRRSRRVRSGDEDGRVDVPLDRPAAPMPALQGREVHPPVHREHLRRKLRVGVHEVRRILHEEDPFHAGSADRLQHVLKVGADEAFPIGAGQQARPGVEHLHRVGARFALADEVARHEPGEAPEQVVEGRRLRGRERAQGREVLHPPPLDEVGGEGPGRAAEAEQRRAGRHGGADVPEGGDHLRRDLAGIGLAEGRHRGRGPDGLRHHRTRLEVEVDAEGRNRAHDVGEHDRRVEGKAPERLQGDLGRELRLARELLEAVALAKRPVFGEIAAGLTHDPKRPARDRLARDGALEEGRRGPSARFRPGTPRRLADRGGSRAAFRLPRGRGGRVRVSRIAQPAGTLPGRPGRGGGGAGGANGTSEAGGGGRMRSPRRPVTAISPGARPGSGR